MTKWDYVYVHLDRRLATVGDDAGSGVASYASFFTDMEAAGAEGYEAVGQITIGYPAWSVEEGDAGREQMNMILLKRPRPKGRKRG